MNLLKSVFGYEFCKSRLHPVLLMITCTLHHSFLLLYFKQNLTGRQEYPAYEIPLKIFTKDHNGVVKISIQ